MSSSFNNLLRPKAEFSATFHSLLLAMISWVLQGFMLFTPVIGKALTVFFLLSSLYSGYRGYRLYRYHRGLVTKEPYKLTTDKLFRSSNVYFLGKGFNWTAEHAKRIKDLYDRRNLSFKEPSRFGEKIRDWALVNCDGFIGSKVDRWINSYNLWNPFPPPCITGFAGTHGVGLDEQEKEITIDLDASSHIIIFGGTGSGKTSAMVVLMAQDVDSGRPTIAIDPKGGYKVFSAMYDAAVRNGKISKFKIIHLAFPEHSAQYNALGNYNQVTEVATRLTEGIDSKDDAFKQFAWLKANYIAVALHYIGRQATFSEISNYLKRCDDLVCEYCEKYVKENAGNDAIKVVESALKTPLTQNNNTGHSSKAIKMVKAVNDLIEANLLPDSDELQMIMSYVSENIMHENKLIRNIEPILQKLTTGRIAQIVVPDYEDDTERMLFDWGQLINDEELAYFGTNALGDITVSSTFCQILLEDLTNYLGTRYQYGQDYGRMTASKDKRLSKSKISIHIDELSAIKTVAIRNLLARAGELGVRLRIYTQSYADVITTLGSKELAESSLDNFGTIIMFRVNKPETADVFVNRLSTVGIEKSGNMYAYADSSSPETPEHFSSSAMQREETVETTLVTAADLQSLPTGEAFVVQNGQRVLKIRVPWVEPNPDLAPTSITDMVQVMKQNDLATVSATDYEDTWFKNTYSKESESTPYVSLGALTAAENEIGTVSDEVTGL